MSLMSISDGNCALEWFGMLGCHASLVLNMDFLVGVVGYSRLFREPSVQIGAFRLSPSLGWVELLIRMF